ncbi:MAG: TetR/AcrR family transcriptional regulator [Actinomycetes bacterium]
MPESPSVVSLTPNPGTRLAILAAARELFEERGYDATSLRLIAEKVGTTKAAVYYHFPAKEQMLLELTRPMLDAFADLVARFRYAGAGRSEPLSVLESYLDLFLDHMGVVGLLAREPATQHHPDIGRRLRLLAEAVQQHMAGDEPTDESLTRAACAMGVIHAVSSLTPGTASSQRSIVLAAAAAALSATSAASPTTGPRRKRPPARTAVRRS